MEGYRGLLAPWIGGAGTEPPPTINPGYTSLLAFWVGGAANNGETPPETEFIDWIIRARRHLIR